jgi:hypothetical protein
VPPRPAESRATSRSESSRVRRAPTRSARSWPIDVVDADELEQIAGYILSGRAEVRTAVHREHAATTQLEPREDRLRSAAAKAAFHKILVQNEAGPYARPADEGRAPSWLGSIGDLLSLLLR